MAEPEPATATVGALRRALRAGSEKSTSHCNHYHFVLKRNPTCTM